MNAPLVGPVDITVDGTSLGGDLVARLVAVRVAMRLSAPTQCELTFDTYAGSGAETEIAPLGASITVRMAVDPVPLFTGEVTCFEVVHCPDGGSLVRIRAYDRLHRLRKRQQLRVFEAVTAEELAAELTRDLAITVHADDSGPRWERIVQHHQRDFELLSEVAGKAGLFLQSSGDELRLVTLDGAGDPVEVDLGVNLLEARIEANLDRASRRCTAYGWDTLAAQVIEESALTPRSGRHIAVEPDPVDVGVDGDLFLVDQAGRNVDEVAAVAQAALDVRTSRAVVLDGVAEGNAGLRAGGRVDVKGVAEAFCGTYVVCEVVHTVDGNGYLSTFSTAPPEPAPAIAATNALTLGVITEVDDPDSAGRVKVSLPAHGDADVGWLGVVVPGAGPGKGLVALPDVDDTVLVALPQGGPVGGLVLGSLFGANQPPDTGISNGRVQRWSLRTANGQVILVDDESHRIRLQNQTGSHIDLSQDLVTVSAASDLVLQAPGRAVTIRAKTVDFIYAGSPDEPPNPDGDA